MPSRYLREGFLDSEQVEQVDEPAAMLYVRLILVSDDYARFDGRLAMIERACWPNGKNVPDKEELERRLQALADAKDPTTGQGLIVRYEAAGKPFLMIPKFGQRTRAVKSKYPDPPHTYPQDQPEMTDNPPTTGWQPADKPPQSVSSSQAGSVSVSRSVSIKTRAREIMPDKSRTTRGQVNGHDNSTTKQAASLGIHARPGESWDQFQQRVTEAQARKDRGQSPEPPKEQPEDLDAQGEKLGMERLKLESDSDYAGRIQARINLG
jgi:hypothetical protein